MAQGAGGRGALVWLSVLVAVMLATSGCSNVARSLAAMDVFEDVVDSICGTLSGLDRDHCYQQIAKFNGDGKLCDKIEHPGPKSKCFIYVAETTNIASWCSDYLGRLASGDGAYTTHDCIQYLAVQWQHPRLCEELKELGQSGSNDLNPKGVSEKTCLDLAGKTCGKIGQKACIDRQSSLVKPSYYCMEGDQIGGMCNPYT